MLSAPELDGQCEEHWPSMFGYDRREILCKDILSLGVSTVHIGVYAIYDIYVFFFAVFCLKVVTIKHMGCIWHGWNG